MTVQEIIQLPSTALKPYGKELSDAYWEIFRLRVCLSCSGEVIRMIYKLKKYYEMINFELKKPAVIYRLEKGKPQTISNDIMTDELAIEFLKLNTERIELFSKYPENWLELLSPEEDIDEDVEGAIDEAINKDLEEDCDCDGETPINEEPDCKPCLEAKLKPMKVKEIQKLYPAVKYKGGTSKVAYIEQIASHLNLK